MAISRTIGRLGVLIEANTSGLRRDLSSATQEFERFGNRVSGSLGRAGSALATFGRVGITGLLGGAALSSIKSIVDGLDNIGKSADRIGITTKTFQQLSYAAERSGIEMSVVEEGLGRFTKRLGQAQLGNKAYAETFKQLGIAIKDQNGKFRQSDQVLTEVFDSLNNVKDQTVATAEAASLFGVTGGAKILAVAKDFKTLAAEADKLGLVIDDKLLRQAADINDQFTVASKVIGVQLQSAILSLAPVLTGLANLIAKSATYVRSFTDALKDLATTSTSEVFNERAAEIETEIKARESKIIEIQRKRGGDRTKAIQQLYDNQIAVEKSKLQQLYKQRGDLIKNYRKDLKKEGDLAPVEFTKGKQQSLTSSGTTQPGKDADAQVEAYKRVKEEVEKYHEALRTPEEVKNDQLALIESLRQQGLTAEDAIRGQIKANSEYAKAIQIVNKKTEEMKTPLKELGARWEDFNGQINNALTGTFERATDELATFVTTGKANFKDLAQSILQSLLRISIQKSLTTAFPSLFGGFGGGRASGGLVGAGSVFPVGERGPELFVAPTAGRIVPHGQATSMVNASTAKPPIINVINKTSEPLKQRTETKIIDNQVFVNLYNENKNLGLIS